MLLLEILLPIYICFAIIIFLVINKHWSFKNHIALNIFYAITLLIPYPLEILVNKLIRHKYIKNTPKVIELLQSKNIKFHIVFGTFLFAYRNNNFADDDIDLAVFRDEFTEETSKSLKNLGFILKEQWSLDGKIMEQTYSHNKMKISMDIFHMSREENFAPAFDEKNNRYARRPKAFKYTVSPIKVCGLVVDAPSKPEDYLEWNYGDWKKPDKNYQWFLGSSSAPSIVVENANIEYKKFD